MKVTDMSDEQTHTYYSYQYYAGLPNVRIDVWYYENNHMTVNILHCDKNSAVAQLFREDIDNRHIKNTREDVEAHVIAYARDALRELHDAIPEDPELGTMVAERKFWWGYVTIRLAIHDKDDRWQLVCTVGNIVNFQDYKPSLIMINEFASKQAFTLETAMNELVSRFKIECLGMLADFETGNIKG